VQPHGVHRNASAAAAAASGALPRVKVHCVWVASWCQSSPSRQLCPQRLYNRRGMYVSWHPGACHPPPPHCGLTSPFAVAAAWSSCPWWPCDISAASNCTADALARATHGPVSHRHPPPSVRCGACTRCVSRAALAHARTHTNTGAIPPGTQGKVRSASAAELTSTTRWFSGLAAA
jgi:hypothetical protein